MSSKPPAAVLGIETALSAPRRGGENAAASGYSHRTRRAYGLEITQAPYGEDPHGPLFALEALLAGILRLDPR